MACLEQIGLISNVFFFFLRCIYVGNRIILLAVLPLNNFGHALHKKVFKGNSFSAWFLSFLYLFFLVITLASTHAILIIRPINLHHGTRLDHTCAAFRIFQYFIMCKKPVRLWIYVNEKGIMWHETFDSWHAECQQMKM